ncbi:hypothetical protein AX760_06140 [Pararhizobium antarcticum]|uniref:Uncharacterized protein n=1 Tax=Pararhizobium antarcticum TaxID=1798805 RepID=A0A657LRV4_9HYPH|nr:hypothetical protein AX760_06140 [Pararhizobium antarcticum]OJF94824.1 hypothetical protein AX761_04165 [Rhizobium sp. 58]
MSKLIRNPVGVELVQETTLSGFRDWFIHRFGGLDQLPQVFVDLLNKPEVLLAPLLDELQPGDKLWLCRSLKIGVLYGHEGIALVRDRQPLIYLRVIDY